MSWIPDTIRGVSFNVVAINLTIQGPISSQLYSSLIILSGQYSFNPFLSLNYTTTFSHSLYEYYEPIIKQLPAA